MLQREVREAKQTIKGCHRVSGIFLKDSAHHQPGRTSAAGAVRTVVTRGPPHIVRRAHCRNISAGRSVESYSAPPPVSCKYPGVTASLGRFNNVSGPHSHLPLTTQSGLGQ